MRQHFLTLFLATGLAFAANAPRFALAYTATNFSGIVVTADSDGNTYMAGRTLGSPFAATPGAYPGTCFGGGPGALGPGFQIPCGHLFLIKLDPSGNVVFETYMGGNALAVPSAITVDSQGGIYVAGTVDATSVIDTSFPITPGAAFPVSSAASVAGEVTFVLKLNASGAGLGYSTVIPGATIRSIAADGAGNVFFSGSSGGGFPAGPGAYQSTPLGQSPAVIGKLNAAGSALVWGTYLSGAVGSSNGIGVAVDSGGNVLVGGITTASDFPATAGQFSTNFSNANTFLAKLSADGRTLISASLLGPASPSAMKVASTGDIYFLCQAPSTFPITNSSLEVTPSVTDPFFILLHVSADGFSVLNSIYLPLSPYPGIGALDLDSVGNAYVVGPGSLPTSQGVFQPSPLDGNPDQVVIVKVTPAGEIAGATYLGATSAAPTIATEPDGSVLVVGAMGQIDLPGLMTPPQPLGTGAFLAANFFPALTLENAASYVANIAVPGELVAIRGYGIGPATSSTSSPAASLGGVQVYFDKFAAPIIYAQATQINVQVPWEIAGQTSTQLKILYNGAIVGNVTIPVRPALPGVLYIENADGSINSPASPAHAGETIAIYGTGGGTLSASGVTAGTWPLSPLSNLTQSVSAMIGAELAAAIPYAGSAPTLDSSVFQINVTLPADLTPGTHPLFIKIGGVASAGKTVSIQ